MSVVCIKTNYLLKSCWTVKFTSPSWNKLNRVEIVMVNCISSYLWLQEEGEVASDQSLKEFEGATLRYASINLKYVP